MNHSPTTPNHKGHDKDTNSQVNFTQLVDIQVSIKKYSYYVQKSAGIIKKLQGRIVYLENQKLLNGYQETRRAEAEEVVIILLGIQKCAWDMIKHIESNEAGEWQEVATSAAQNKEFTEMMQQKFKEKYREIEELKKENEELKELLHKCITELAA